MTHDGLGKYLSQVIEKAPGPTADVVGILKERKVDVMVSYLPVGSEEATKWYVEQALKAGVGFVNAIPVFIGREPYWQRRFAEEGLPVIGDDIKSQVGATITHRVLTRLFMDRGVRIDRTYQLNFGGNTDFLNMLERERLESKKISKTNAVTSMLDYEMDADDIHVGPSDYVPWLKDRKWCHIRIEGTTFGDVPLNAELKLEVWDSPNSAGVIIDAIRCLKIGLDRGLKGTLVAPSSYFMKSPPLQIHDDVAHQRVEAFIRGEDNETLVGTEEPDQGQLRSSRPRRPRRSRRQRRRRPRGERRAQRPRGAPPAPRAGRPRILEQARGRRLRVGDAVVAHVPGRARPLGDRDGVAGRLPRSGRRSVAGRTRTSATSSGSRPTTRASGGWRSRRTASTRATWSSSCASRRDRASRPAARVIPGRPRPHRGRSGRRRPAGLIFAARPRRQQRGRRRRGRRSRLAGERRRRRLVLPRAVRAAPAPARGVGRPRHPVAQPARALQGAPARRDPRPAGRLGLPPRRDPGPAVRRVDDAAGRSRDARGEDRPAILPVAIRRTPDGRFQCRYAPGHHGRVVRAGRPPARHPGDRRLARGDDRRRAGPVVQLQADLARDRRRGGELEARAAAMLADTGDRSRRREATPRRRADADGRTRRRRPLPRPQLRAAEA